MRLQELHTKGCPCDECICFCVQNEFYTQVCQNCIDREEYYWQNVQLPGDKDHIAWRQFHEDPTCFPLPCSDCFGVGRRAPEGNCPQCGGTGEV